MESYHENRVFEDTVMSIHENGRLQRGHRKPDVGMSRKWCVSISAEWLKQNSYRWRGHVLSQIAGKRAGNKCPQRLLNESHLHGWHRYIFRSRSRQTVLKLRNVWINACVLSFRKSTQGCYSAIACWTGRGPAIPAWSGNRGESDTIGPVAVGFQSLHQKSMNRRLKNSTLATRVRRDNITWWHTGNPWCGVGCDRRTKRG